MGVTDLGTVPLAAPARLRIDDTVDLDALELCALRADLDVRAEEVAPRTRELRLPPGRRLALWKGTTGVVRRELAAGAGAVLDAR